MNSGFKKGSERAYYKIKMLLRKYREYEALRIVEAYEKEIIGGEKDE